MLRRPYACVFDLDGTLVDSLHDIAHSLNECLELLGLPTHPVPNYRYMVGEGVPKLCQRAIGQTHPHLVSRLIELARARYRTRILERTEPYPGVTGLVGALEAEGVILGVLSNKPHELTCRIVEQFWPDGTFASVQGYVEEALRKPNPHYLQAFCTRAAIQPNETWYVGDTPTDVETAKRAGCPSVGVTWGFRDRSDLADAGADWIVDHPSEIAAAVVSNATA